jgi:hypothetical protein
MIGGGCSSSASGSSNGQTHTTPTTCVVIFETGEQFSCREGVKARTPAGVAATSGCRRIALARFPAAWKVVLRQIAAVRDCLRHRGDRVIENVVTSGCRVEARVELSRTTHGWSVNLSSVVERWRS